MKVSPKITATTVLLVTSMVCGWKISRASAEPMHTPTKMPMAKAESVGMSTEGLNHIDDVMQEYIDAGTIQGGVTAVARRGKVVHFSTHGDMDVDKGRAMEPDAIFRMASSAKAVVGVATMILVDEGLISPSDPVSKFIPEFADVKVAVLVEPADGKGKPKPTSKSKGKSKAKDKTKGKGKGKGSGEVPEHRLVPVDTPLTIHHLLTHTAGLMTRGLGQAVGPVVSRTADDTRATYIPRLAKVPLDFQPGTQRRYSPGGGITVVTRIIEIVSETPFDEFVQKRIFDPLKMNNSYYYGVPSNRESKRVVIPGLDASAKRGGWGLSSTAEDYLHFQQMLLNDGELFGNRVISPEAVRMMSSNQVGDIDLTGPKSRKGMGHGYTVGVTLDPDVAANYRGKGAFGGGGAAGTMSWTDPENELVAVIMLQQPRGGMQAHFAKAIHQAIIK